MGWLADLWGQGCGTLVDQAVEDRIDALLAFNDLYDEYLGDVRDNLRQIGLAPPDLRVFRRIVAGGQGVTAAWLAWQLRMDAGQLSRSLRLLQAHGVIAASREPPDRRVVQVRVTGEGRRLEASIARRLRPIAAKLLGCLGREERGGVMAALESLSGILRHRRNSSLENDLVPHEIPRLRRAD